MIIIQNFQPAPNDKAFVRATGEPVLGETVTQDWLIEKTSMPHGWNGVHICLDEAGAPYCWVGQGAAPHPGKHVGWIKRDWSTGDLMSPWTEQRPAATREIRFNGGVERLNWACTGGQWHAIGTSDVIPPDALSALFRIELRRPAAAGLAQITFAVLPGNGWGRFPIEVKGDCGAPMEPHVHEGLQPAWINLASREVWVRTAPDTQAMVWIAGYLS